MLSLLLFLLYFLSNVAALNITVQSNTLVGQPSLVMWQRVPSDGNGPLRFDLRFVKPDNEDKGLALANMQASPSTKFGTARVVFPSSGTYRLVAVSGPRYTWIGQSAPVNAIQVPIPATSIPAMSTSQAVPSPTKSAKPTPTVTSSGVQVHPNRKKNIGAIIGGTLGGVAFLGLVAALGMVFLRRRRRRQLEPPTTTKENDRRTRRWTFNRDKMILPPVLDIRRTTPLNAEFFSSPQGDIEHGLLPHDDTAAAVPGSSSTSPVVVMMAPSSSGSKPLLKSSSPQALRTLPLPPQAVVLNANPQQEDVVLQMEHIRKRMRELEKNPGPAQHIILDDLQKQLNWFESQYLK